MDKNHGFHNGHNGHNVKSRSAPDFVSRNGSRNEGRDRNREAVFDHHGLRFVIRDVIHGSVKTVIFTVHTVWTVNR